MENSAPQASQQESSVATEANGGVSRRRAPGYTDTGCGYPLLRGVVLSLHGGVPVGCFQRGDFALRHRRARRRGEQSERGGGTALLR